MMAELHRELVRRAKLLAKEESGVALMLTLSVFLMLYVACAGVYAIGETVRQKIELQNACDSAAYSAAVVQADGLSRMAMVNRALSWTYVQLTNLQMDYITSKWLRLVAKRFQEDSDACESHNKRSRFIHLFGPPCDHNCEGKYSGAGKGWFCGTGLLHGSVKLNGRGAVSIETLKQIPSMDQYEEQIQFLKGMIVLYNAQLATINIAMQHSIQATACATLYANLPQVIKDDGDIEYDKGIGKDMYWYVKMTFPDNPYARFDPSSESKQDSASSESNREEVYPGYFSPLYNTEAGERIFLTMADGACYDRLEPYFSNEKPERMESGGLDQWFIRSYPEESYANAERIPAEPQRLGQGESNPLKNSYSMPGICRVYKNANREEGVDAAGVARGHHKASLFGSLLGGDDNLPSCINDRKVFAEQCGSVENTAALYADYEWAAVAVRTLCWWTYSLFYPPKCNHSHFGLGVMNVCPHLCRPCAGADHRRNPKLDQARYRGDGEQYETWTNSCYESQSGTDELTVLHGVPHQFLPMPDMWGFGTYLRLFPNGYARIYGDDDEIYDKDTYTGQPARPWILNERFYSTDGAIIVGLARKQRNPFLALFDSLADGLKDKDDEVQGIYSAFNPVTNGYITAFSAARAAHRFHPSQQQWSVIQGMRHHPLPDSRDYETRYDSVCHDDITDDIKDEGKVKLQFDCADDTLREGHIGCVCKNEENFQRFARCWNLWQTDWDATLLPVPYAQAGSKVWFDSYLHDKASSSGGNANEQGNITWHSVEDQLSKGETPFDDALAEVPWYRFFDEDGNLITDEDRNGSTDENEMWKGGVGGGQFLPMQHPKQMGQNQPMNDEELERHFRALLMQRIL